MRCEDSRSSQIDSGLEQRFLIQHEAPAQDNRISYHLVGYVWLQQGEGEEMSMGR